MSIQDAAEYFHKADYQNAAEILKNYLSNAEPTVQHNHAINVFYTKSNPRSQSKVLLKKLNHLQSSYPQGIANRSTLLFNEAELQLNRHQYTKSVDIFKSLIDIDADASQHVPLNIYFRSCLRLFSIYLHHDMVEDAQHIHAKLSAMSAEDVSRLDAIEDDAVSSLKHAYWCSMMACHLKLIAPVNTHAANANHNASSSLSPAQEAYKELTKAIDLVKQQKQASQATNDGQQEQAWPMLYKIRILFSKAHQDFVAGHIHTAKSQLFATHNFCKQQPPQQQQQQQPPMQIAFLNNMACVYAMNDECGSAMSLIQRALSLHAQYMDSSPLYAADQLIAYLCYNAGLLLQNLRQYARAIDCFLCCLPVLQSKPRLWLRMAQCVLAVWEPYGGFENHVGHQPQISALVTDIVEANSTKRGDLLLLPVGRKPLLYNNIHKHELHAYENGLDGHPQEAHGGDDAEQEQAEEAMTSHILKWHTREDADFSFPYHWYKEREQQSQLKRERRWKKRKETQKEFVAKTRSIAAELKKCEAETENGTSKTQVSEPASTMPADQQRLQRQKREQRLYQKEKSQQREQLKEDRREYEFQIRELKDMKLAVEWLKNAISLFKKMETRLQCTDFGGHKSAHLHLSYCYLKLKAWNFALCHAEKTLTIHQRESLANTAPQPPSFVSTHDTYLAHMYAAEALVNLRQFQTAIKHLNPSMFPHLIAAQQHKESATPKSCKSGKSTKSKTDSNATGATATAADDSDEKEEGKQPIEAEEEMVHAKQTWQQMKEAYFERESAEKENEECSHYLTILVNLATTYICKDELNKAHKYLYKALTINDAYHPALRMLIYLQMRMGNNNEAIKIIKYRRPIPVKQFMQNELF